MSDRDQQQQQQQEQQQQHHYEQLQAAKRRRKRPARKTVIDISTIKSVARPDQLRDTEAELPLTFGSLVRVNEVTADALFDLDENDPIIQQLQLEQQQQQQQLEQQEQQEEQEQEEENQGETTTAAAASNKEKATIPSPTSKCKSTGKEPPMFSPLRKSRPKNTSNDDEMNRKNDNMSMSMSVSVSSRSNRNRNTTRSSQDKDKPQEPTHNNSPSNNTESSDSDMDSESDSDTTSTTTATTTTTTTTNYSQFFPTPPSPPIPNDETQTEASPQRKTVPKDSNKYEEEEEQSEEDTHMKPKGYTRKEIKLLTKIKQDIDQQEERELLQLIKADIDKQEQEEHHQQQQQQHQQQHIQQQHKMLLPQQISDKVVAENTTSQEMTTMCTIEPGEIDELIDKQDASTSITNDNHNHNQKPNALASATKIVPKFFQSLQHTDSLLSVQQFSNQVLHPFLQEYNLLSGNNQEFTAVLQECQDDDNSYLLTAKGTKDTLDKFRLFFRRWFAEQWAQHCHQDLISDECTIEMNVLMNRQELLNVWNQGFFICICKWDTNGADLWVDFSSQIMEPCLKKLFGSFLDNETLQSDALAVVIRKINGRQCTTGDEWLAVGEELKISTLTDVHVTLIVSGYADFLLTSINQSRMVGEPRAVSTTNQETATVPVPMVTVDAAASPTDYSDLGHSLTLSRGGNGSPTTAAEPEEKEKKDTPLPPPQAPAAIANRQFKQKYKSVYDIEYHRSEIGYQFALKCMWKNHKSRFGKQCNDDCPCALELDYLTESVVPEWVKEQLKKNGKSWNAPWQNDSPAGFVSRFAPKFTPLLREKYPDDNPRQILARLENMWNKGHVCQTNFGIRCEKFCTCKDGWRSVFHEGDMDNATSSRNNKRISKCASSDLVASAIPRKRSRTDVPVTNDAEKKSNSFGARYESYVDMQQSARKKESAAPLHRNPSPSEESKSYIDNHGEITHRERTENTRSDARLSSEMNGLNDTNREAVLWPFCLCFRSFLPLGFYCITAESESRGSTCKITSVDPNGECRKKSALVRAGSSIVDAVEIKQGGQWVKYEVSSHDLLMQYYNLSKEIGGDIKLWFNNMEAQEQSPFSASTNQDWSSDGKWRGTMQAGGWPGGAEVLPHTLASPTFSSRTHGSVAAPSSKTIGDSEPDEGISVTSFGSSSQRPRPPISSSHSGSKQIVSMQESREPGHRFQEPKASIVNRGVRNKESVSSKVRFNTDSVEAFYYNKASPSCRLHCRKHTDDTPDPQKAISGTTAIVPLAEAIHKARNNDVQGFLLCLQKPGQIQANDLTSVYEYTRRKGYETVHNILRIYKASSLAVGLAQSLKMWEAFEIRIRSITGLYVADLASSKSITTFKGAVYFYVNEAGKKHTSLPPMDLDSYVDYGSGAAALPEYGPLHYNSALKDDRRLVIHLHSPSGDMVPIAKLGIPLGEVREICTVYDNYFSTEREFKCEDAVKPGVKLHFQASRKRVNPDHLEKKRQEGANDLANVVEWIERFNYESNYKLKATIVGNQNWTLLHAAIIYQRSDLLLRLLSLDADCNFKSEQGSAVAFNMSLVDRERDHLKYLKYKCEEQRAATDGSDRVALEETEAKIRRQERKLKCHEDMARILLLASKNAAKDSTDRPREVSPAAATATKNASDYAGRQSPEYSRYSLNARNNANSIPFMDHVTTNVAHMKMPGEETTDNFGIGESFSEDSSALAPHKKRRNSDLDRSDYDDVSLIVICQSVYNNGSAWVIAPNAANEFYRLMGNKRHKYADARDKAVAKGYMECKRRSGGHPACHLQLTPIGTSFVKHAFLFYLCRAIRSLAPSSEWVLETKVDAPFYNNARKLKPEEGKFGEARRQAMSMGLVELGRVATGIPSKPIIKCTCDQSTTGYYLRLTSLGMAFLQQPNKPIETLSSDLRKRKFAALDSDDSRAKRRGNPIVMNDGTLPPQAPTAAKFTAAPIENPKEAKKPDAVDNISVVLGGVAKYTVTDGAEQNKDLSCSDDVLFILDSIDVIGDKWVKNGDAAREFYRKLGNPNKPRFRDARDEATHAGFIEWGRHDLSDPKRAVVVQKDRLERKSMSVNSYLRLTSLGRNVLESQRTFKSTSKAQPGEDNRNYPKLSKGGKFWFVSKSGAPRTVCHFFSGASGAGCRKGRECGFLHVQPPPSRKKLKDPRLVPIRLPIHEICYYEEDDATGRSWVTAAFHDRSSNIYYKAAGDRSGQKDSDGIWWYQTREEARKALERAISASLY